MDGRSRLAAALADPPLQVNADDLCALWRIDWLRFSCARPDLLEDYPELAVRIRGAFGRRLAEHAAARETRPALSRLGAYDALFTTFHAADGREIPKPTVIRAELSHERVSVDLGLVGAAAAWMDEAADAMQAALNGGVNLRADGRLRAPLPVLEIGWRRESAIDVPVNVSSVAMIFRTPVVVRAGGALRADPRAILRSCARRAAALAPWQSARLLETPAVSGEIDNLEIDDRELLPYRFERHSRRRGNEPIPVAGYLGRMTARGRLDEFAARLAIAGKINVGSHASLGLGAADIVLAP